MSKKIFNELSEHFILRMQNWARANSGAGVYATSSLFSLMRGGSGYGRASTPVQIGEAEDTDRALRELPGRYRQAVSLFWQYPNHPLSWFARRSGVGVDYRTFEARVMRGHDLLRVELIKQRDRVEAYKARARYYSQKD